MQFSQNPQALQNVDGLTFSLLNQMKIAFTAVLLYIFMGKKQTGAQIVGLAGIMGTRGYMGHCVPLTL